MKNLTPLQTCEVSAELLILFQENPGVTFTVRSLRRIINLRYHTNLKTKRVKQIVDIMADRGRIERVAVHLATKPGETGSWCLNGSSDPRVLYGTSEFEALTILLENVRGIANTGS